MVEWAVIFAILSLVINFIKPSKDPFCPEVFLGVYFWVLIGAGPIVYLLSFSDVIQDTFEKTMFIMYSGFFCLNMGFLYARLQERKVVSYCKPLINKNVGLEKNVAIIFIIIGVMALSIFFARAGNVPMLSDDKEYARVAALSVSGNGYFLYISFWAMYATLIYFILAFVKPESKSKLFFVVFALIFVLFLGTGSRRFSMWLVLFVLISAHYIVKPIRLLSFIGVVILGLVFVNGFELLRGGFGDNIFEAQLYRMAIYFSNMNYVIAAFEREELLLGSTFLMDFLTILPGQQVDYQSYLKDMTGLEFEGFGLPPTLFGDIFINFSYAGVIIFSGFLGYILRSIYYKKIVLKKAWYWSDIVIYIVVLEVSSKIMTSGVSPQVFLMFFICMFLFGFRLICDFLSGKKIVVF